MYRVFNAAWCVLLLYATAVQYNDPDPIRWMLLYGGGAAIMGYAALAGDIAIPLPASWGAISAIAAGIDLTIGSGQVEPMGGFPYWNGPGGDALRNEIVREVLGLLLMSGCTISLAVWTLSRRRAAR